MADQTSDLTEPEYEHRPSFRLVPRRDQPFPADDELDLFDQPVTSVPPAEPRPDRPDTRKPTIEERFAIFLEEQPDVVFEFVELTRKAKAAGRNKISGKMLIEVIRWGMFIDHDRSIKINNVITAHLVRHVQREYPELAEMFDTRELLSK